jgi:protein-S-isoprenylcysteine O-methyltransferase Ste14
MLKILSLVAYLAMVAGLIGLIIMRSLFSASPVVIALQTMAILLGVWARVTFGRRSFHLAANPTQGGLVTDGPYRYIRHPIYAAACLFTCAGVFAHWSWTAGLLGSLVLAGGVVRALAEEALLTQRYPEYRQYAARTWRMIPFVF